MLTAAYVGEAENICRRLGGYLNPGSSQKTNVRIKAFLDERRTAGVTIRFEVLEFGNFVINGLEINRDRLTNPYVRKLIENLAIALHRSERCVLLNSGTDVVEKAIDRIASSMPASNPEARENFRRSAIKLINRDSSEADS